MRRNYFVHCKNVAHFETKTNLFCCFLFSYTASRPWTVHLVDIYSRHKFPTTSLSIFLIKKNYKHYMLSLRIISTLKEGGGKQDFPFYLIISFCDIWVSFVEETFFLFVLNFCSWAVSEPALQNLDWFVVWSSLTGMSRTWSLNVGTVFKWNRTNGFFKWNHRTTDV